MFENPILEANDSDLQAISMFPNPTTNLITISSPLLNISSAKVYDIRGRKVSEVNFRNQISYKIDLSNMEPAVYFIDITTEIGTITKRVIKND